MDFPVINKDSLTKLCDNAILLYLVKTDSLEFIKFFFENIKIHCPNLLLKRKGNIIENVIKNKNLEIIKYVFTFLENLSPDHFNDHYITNIEKIEDLDVFKFVLDFVKVSKLFKDYIENIQKRAVISQFNFEKIKYILELISFDACPDFIFSVINIKTEDLKEVFELLIKKNRKIFLHRHEGRNFLEYALLAGNTYRNKIGFLTDFAKIHFSDFFLEDTYEFSHEKYLDSCYGVFRRPF